MPNIRITGGTPLSGIVATGYSKNAALPILAACLLTDEPSILRHMPRIEEIFRFEEIFVSLGVKFEWMDEHTVKITPPQEISFETINAESAKKTRSILYLIGALVSQYSEFYIPKSGGCLLGKRTTSPHFYALEHLGIKVYHEPERYHIKSNKQIKGSYIVMYESGDTATNNAILASVRAKGVTTIKQASCNYMVQDLCYMLVSMGAKIEGIGTPTLKITGVNHLSGTDYTIMNDPIESMFWIALAATTNSHITITGCPKEFLEIELYKLEKMRWRFQVIRKYKSANGHFDLLDINTFPSDLKALKEKIDARPFPGINIDNLPYFVPIVARARGRSLIFDWCYEDRALYFTELKKLGCDMILADPHRLYIEGSSTFQPNELICPPALRPATMLLCAMFAAKGVSLLRNTYPIDRGHENLYERLKNLGAQLEILE